MNKVCTCRTVVVVQSKWAGGPSARPCVLMARSVKVFIVMICTCQFDGRDVLQAELARKVALLRLALDRVLDCSCQALCLHKSP